MTEVKEETDDGKQTLGSLIEDNPLKVNQNAAKDTAEETKEGQSADDVSVKVEKGEEIENAGAEVKGDDLNGTGTLKLEEGSPDKSEPVPGLKSEEKNGQVQDRNAIGSNGKKPERQSTRPRNIKSDASSLEISSDPHEIRKQVEFYFSDSNLPRDKFLSQQVGGTKNLPVKIKILHNFSRMRRFQPYEAIVAALRESEVLEVTDDEEVRRKTPLDEGLVGQSVEEGIKLVADRTLSRSVYAKGFGDETPTTQFEIEAFFAPYGPTNAIRLRRKPNKVFKGSVFVEFADDATQQAFLALDPKPKWKGTELLIKSKKDYVEGKAADIAAGCITGSETRKRGAGTDSDNWKKRREEDQKSGFKNDNRRDQGNRGGRGRGFGRGGRGRGGRGGRSFRGRDSNQVPKIATSAPEPDDPVGPTMAPEAVDNSDKSKDTNGNNSKAEPDNVLQALNGKDTATTPSDAAAMDVDAASKKRVREDDEVAAEARKKVDVKA